jgi:predicted ATP-dependent protease
MTQDTGEIVPRANHHPLMLAQDVVDDAASGRFSVWALETADQTMELLTGKPAAEVRRRVVERLDAYADIARKQRAR